MNSRAIDPHWCCLLLDTTARPDWWAAARWRHFRSPSRHRRSDWRGPGGTGQVTGLEGASRAEESHRICRRLDARARDAQSPTSDRL